MNVLAIKECGVFGVGSCDEEMGVVSGVLFECVSG